MKKNFFVILVIVSLVLFYFWKPFQEAPDNSAYEDKEGVLLSPQRNVAIVTLNMNENALSFTSAHDFLQLRPLQKDFREIPGVTQVESILSVYRVISTGEDASKEIIIERAIPENDNAVTDAYLEKLAGEIGDFPELLPYVNSSQNTLLFYISFANKIPPQQIFTRLKNLQEQWSDRINFAFTGRAAVIAETEALLTKDLFIFFPLLGLVLIAVFSFFRNIKVTALSLALIILSVAWAYGLVHFIGIPDSPLLLLIPIFSMGLLSDYLIHYFYHRLNSTTEKYSSSVRRQMFFPLSLTALSTLIGFLSLSLIDGSGHLQLGILIAVAVTVTWLGVFCWLDFGKFKVMSKPLFIRFQNWQVNIFVGIARFRYIFFIVLTGIAVWSGTQINKLTIEPYPVNQLPESAIIKKADRIINDAFYGTVPFFIEVDTGEKNGILKKSTLMNLDKIHTTLARKNVGFAYSMLSVLKRMHFHFMGDEESLLTSTEFDDNYDALIEQYMLYYSSGVDPLEYESLLDNSYRVFSIKGMLYYRSYADLNRFMNIINDIHKWVPNNWSISVYGTAEQLFTEHTNLRNNWVLSFLGGSLLIFLTVLIFYRRLFLAVISLIPAIISMVISLGFISLMGMSIDAFSIIFVAIITGLVVDYSIHTLVALNQIKTVGSLRQGFKSIIGYSGIPIFLSFSTSLLSFSVLFVSSFNGARNLGFLLLVSLLLAFFLSLYLIPLINLPIRLLKERNND